MERLAIVLVLLALVAPVGAHEFIATPNDFHCLFDGTKVPGKHFFVFHRKKAALKKALHKLETGKLGEGLPRGTVLQLVPQEAMVMRGGKFNRDGHGWEYFSLDPKSDGTSEILARGTSEVTGAVTHTSCQKCHEMFAADHDAICEFVIGTAGIGLTDDFLALIQNADARCKK